MELNIAVCDDDKIALNNELTLIKNVLNEKKIQYKISIGGRQRRLSDVFIPEN